MLFLRQTGSGPTGVELGGFRISAGTLARDVRNIRPDQARITLIEAGPPLHSGRLRTLQAGKPQTTAEDFLDREHGLGKALGFPDRHLATP